ncbi:nucleotide exchange factor GrpE [Microbacterium sp. MYb66]|jgi:molecular chaperone GrpE|uniref:nucleotide exchange factor GrpE n=1 Tax=Microbacterium sp. MYb66 TaxID=1848692 RepID=UPI000D008E6F|nr:nucleotide exchange factor GrpE [Microbacterium sp. MYb66]PRA79773.1 nucleotide exchange factor GrpE [Microbacterium sp. MYb66]
MTDKNFDDNAGVPEEGSDVNASGPQPDFGNPDSTEAAAAEGSDETPVDGAPDDLTVDDILGATQTGEAAAEDAVLADLESTLLNDLKRLQAEYANYRRRTEEQRQVEIERAKGEAAKGLVPVLDDLDRAAQHGDLVDGTPFAVIADKVRTVVERLGVVAYGEKGEEFDPQRHEAIFQQPTPGAEKTTILEVVEVGYRLGDVELRPAKVVVAVPAE